MTKDEAIAECVDNIDLLKVQHVMEYLNWVWRGSKTSPTVTELRRKATSLLNEAIRIYDGEGESLCASGGLYAAYSGYRLRLWFELSSWEIEEDLGDGFLKPLNLHEET